MALNIRLYIHILQEKEKNVNYLFTKPLYKRLIIANGYLLFMEYSI